MIPSGIASTNMHRARYWACRIISINEVLPWRELLSALGVRFIIPVGWRCAGGKRVNDRVDVAGENNGTSLPFSGFLAIGLLSGAVQFGYMYLITALLRLR